MSKQDCLIFVHDLGFETVDIWNKQKFVIKPNSFSELMGKTHVILATNSFRGAFEVKFFEIPKNTDDFKVFVHFSKFYKSNGSAASVVGLFSSNPDISNGVSGMCTFNNDYDTSKFEVVDYPDMNPATDLKSMKDNIKKLYGQDVEVTITLKS